MTDNDLTKPAKPRARAAKVAAATDPVPAPAPAAMPTSKSETVIKLLLRAKGATPLELIAATDWQPHRLRAFLSGLRKKGRGIVREERKGGGYAYRIVAGKVAGIDAPASTEDVGTTTATTNAIGEAAAGWSATVDGEA